MNSRTNIRFFRKSCLATLVPVLAVTGGNLASAQMPEEIIVTATKRAESLQDIPIAVNALQGDYLMESGIDSQRAISMTTPNVSINVNANFVAPYIRGVGTQYANPGLEPSVASYFNDLYLSRPSAGFMQFFDISRVEVLKGPQGTLYGRNTTGGAIRVITNDPTPEFEAGVGLGLGNYSKVAVDGFVSGPITDNLMGRISFQHDERDGYVKNVVGGEDVENRDMDMLHGKLLWEPSDRLSVKLDADWTDKNDLEGMAFQPLYDGLPTQVGAGGPFGGVISTKHDEYSGDLQSEDRDELKSNFTAGGSQLRIDYEFDTYTFSSITGYRYTNFQGRADLDGSSASLFAANTLVDKTEDLSQEIQLVSNGEGKLDWLVGIFYMKEDAIVDFGIGGDLIAGDPGLAFALGAPFNLTGPLMIGGLGEIEVESFAPYGQISYDITDEWEVMLGLRYTDETKKVQNQFFVASADQYGFPISSQTIFPAPLTEDEFSFTKTTPKIQATWRPTDDVMIYASYSEGLKSGGFNMPQPAADSPAKVDNEIIKAFELGWKTEFERLRLNGAVFHYDIEDLQLQVTDPNAGITSVKNAGEATVDGIELDLTYAATENLQLGAGFGYQKTEFGDIPDGLLNPACVTLTDPADLATCPFNGAFPGAEFLGVASLSGSIKGNDLPQAPELTAFVRASYFMPLDNNGDITFSILANYSDKYYYTSDNLYEEPSKILANMNASWTSSNGMYEANVYVANLTDEEYNTHAAPFAATGGWKVPGPPRTFGARFGINF